MVSSSFRCPLWIAIQRKGFFDTLHLCLLELIRRWYEGSTTSEGMDGGQFVGVWLVAVKGYVLVGVGGLAIDVKAVSVVRIA